MTEIRQKGRYGRYIHIILSLVDFVILNAAFFITDMLSPELTSSNGRLVWLLANLTYVPVAYWLSSTHKVRSLHMDHVVTNSLRAVGMHALLFITSLFFVGIDSLSWKVFAEFYGLCFVLFPLWWIVSRLLLKKYRRRGRNFSRVIIIGTNEASLRLYSEMLSDAGFGYRFLGFFSDDDVVDGIPPELVKGPTSAVRDFVTANSVDEIYFTISGQQGQGEVLKQMMTIADDNVVQFFYVPQLNRYVTRGFDLFAIGSMPVMSVRHNPLMSGLIRR